MNQVLVVESGAKTRTIRGFLGGDYDVVASGGHIVDLPDDELGIDIHQDFTFQTVPITGRNGNAVESLKSKIEDADFVYLATDPDREGEAIAADIRDHAVPPGCGVSRIEFNAIVYPAVKEAIENPREIHENRVEAQRARRTLDRLIGFILSSVVKFDPDGPNAPSVGRVQSPAIRLVVDREDEIESFEPRKYWTIAGQMAADGQSFEITLDGEWDEFDQAKTIVETLTEAGSMTVTACDITPEDTQNPLPPYTTDALQNDADFLFNFEPERTMELAQRLYEGVSLTSPSENDSESSDVDEAESDSDTESESDTKALITYMRTDSTRVSPSALNLAKETLATREDFGEELYRGRTWGDDAGAQDAHEAIRPTQPEDPETWPENLEGILEEPLLQLYRLIYYRFLASQMVPATYRTTTLELATDEYEATAVGHELLDPGFLKVWGEIRPGHQWDEIDLPEPTPGTEIDLDRAWPEPEETQPPPRYREGSLVSELKNRGIGRPSTYGTILSKIKRGSGFGYVRKSGGTLRPTEKGRKLIEYLATEFPLVTDYEYTARMESELDAIEQGQRSYEDFLSTEFEWLLDAYEEAERNGWLESDRATPSQVDYLQTLSEEADVEIPDGVFESKSAVSEWIDDLQDQIDPTLRLTKIHEADVNGVAVHRFRLYFTQPLPDAEYEYLGDLGLKYKRGGDGREPAFQFQRRDRSMVEDVWETLRDRYPTEEIADFNFEIGVEP